MIATCYAINSLYGHKEGALAIKIDMTKVYYRVECSLMSSLLDHLGLLNTWINLVMESVSFSAMVNESPSAQFCPARGLRFSRLTVMVSSKVLRLVG